MKRIFSKKLFIFTVGSVLCMFFIPRLAAYESSSLSSDVIDMVTGDIQMVPVNNLARVSVTNPEVADISDAQGDKVSLLAKKSGSTVLFLWDAAGKRSIKVRVVSEDLSALKAKIQKLLAEANITSLSLEENFDIGKIVVSGAVPKEEKDRAEDLWQAYGENILNLVKEEKNQQLIQVDMQIVEISTTLEKNLGISWANTSTASTSPTAAASTNGATSTLQLGYGEHMATQGDSFAQLFRIGNFQRQTPLEATVNALVQEGKARLISKPRLVVVSGKQASFLVGGEIPIQSTTTSASGGVQQSNTTYTQYGVNLSVTPTIHEAKIDVVLNVDIRDVDNSSSFSTNQNVAFITRTASTDLLMDNKQTIALAGLIKYSDSVTVTEVPFLSKIPVLGAMFRNRKIPGDSSTEMVIILTPSVLTDKKFAEKQLVMPTPQEKFASREIASKYEHETIHSAWPPAKIMSADTSTILPVMTAYARTVQERISSAISVPQSLTADTSLSGTVKLKLHILKTGSLDSVEIMQSSGNDVLDQDAIQAARTAAPYDAFSNGMDQEGIVFTVPIVYNKLISQDQVPAERIIDTY